MIDEVPAHLRALLVALLTCTAMACTGISKAPQPQTVLVAGATGQTGQHIVRQLQKSGYHVRALVRDPDEAKTLLGPDAEFVVGDVRDPAAVTAAMTGAIAVISSIGARAREGPDRPETIDYQGVRNLVDAAKAAKVRQFVLVSSRGVTWTDNPLNRMFGDVLIWKLRGEDYLRASGLAYTVVRPGLLLNEPGGQGALAFEQGDRKSTDQRLIPREDVAEVCVQALKFAEARNRTFEVFHIEGAPVGDWKSMFAGLKADAKP